jgi:hypothetical protein
VGREIEIAHGELRVLFTGLSALASMRREVRIPLSAVKRVRVGPPRSLRPMRVFGFTDPILRLRRGAFTWRGRRHLLVAGRGEPQVTIELDARRVPGRYDVLVIGTDKLEALTSAIETSRKTNKAAR